MIVDFVGDEPVQTVALFNTDEAEVNKLVSHLLNKYFSLLDGITNKFLSLASSPISEFLSDFFNRCIEITQFHTFLENNCSSFFVRR